MNAFMRPWFFLTVLSSALFLTTIGSTRLWDRDEPRNAGCAVEMLARGDWVTPVFNGELRTHKPILLYWCMMAAYAVLGVSEFSARVCSALFGVGTVLCTYGLGRRLAGPQTGLWSGIILATTLMFGVAMRAATPDAPLIFFTVLALWIFVRAAVPAERDGEAEAAASAARLPGPPVVEFPRRVSFRVAFYGTLGLSVLAKGPIGLILPLAVVGSFLLIVRSPAAAPARGDRPWRARVGRGLRHFTTTAWSMHPWTGLLIVLAVAAPWYVWVGYRTDGRWLREFFLEHNWNRARQPMEGHAGPWFYYLLAILPGFFPWSIFLGPTLCEAWHRARRGGSDALATAFCASWLGVWIGAFSLASTKLPSYITPCYPALAVLTASYLVRWARCQELVSSVWPWLSLLSLLLAGVGMAVGLPLAAAQYLPGEQWLGLIGTVPLAAALYGAWWYHQQQRLRVLRVTAVAACLLALGLFGLAAARADRHQQSHQLFAAIARSTPTPQVAYLGALEPSWVFYAGRPLAEVVEPAEVASPSAERGLRGPAERDAAAPTRWDEFLAASPDHFIITTRRKLETLPRLAALSEVVAEAPYFLKRDHLVVLRGRAARTAGLPTEAGSHTAR